MALTALAAVGLLFMLGSQAGESISSPGHLFRYESLIGMIFALISGLLAAIGPLGSLILGEAAYYRLVEESASLDEHDTRNPKDREDQDRVLLLWLTLYGLIVARLVSLPVSLVIGVLLVDGSGGFGLLPALGALALAVTSATGMVLLRMGNIGTDTPVVNALFFVSPLLALAWLMMVGIDLPRFDLFLIGAALIVAINILLRLKPDQESDLPDTDRPLRRGTRLGFTSFIMSIWVFGTVVYLRDELMPSSWLIWSSGEYWGVVALSSTVFALILGFRIARLSTRITKEDETTMGLFRDYEYLVHKYGLDTDVLGKIAQLDVAEPKELAETYGDIRTAIRATRALKIDEPLLLSIEKQLDSITHSKQQGRDIVELLSLISFAMVTVGLGIFSRPDFATNIQSWTAFLSEVFILLFLSTIVFLCTNLFDIRRERETPLMVRSDESGDSREEYSVFFRYKRDLSVQQSTAVLISVFMSAVFCVLLYDKWL